LDRLIDMRPDVTSEPEWSRSQTARDIMNAVRRDLEALLNTRQSWFGDAHRLPEIARSVAAFGMPDYSSAGSASHEDREMLRKAVEQTIRVFEPRMTDVRVTVAPPASESERNVHMTIDAVLQVFPIAEHITFDTFVQPATGVCSVQSRE
jgi:type VI secretion system protein ImpF